MTNADLLRFAIAGLEAERMRIEHLLDELRAEVGGTSPSVRATGQAKAQPSDKRTMSPAGRAAIRAALKRRWAAFHKGKAAAPNVKAKTVTPKKKRVLSPAQLAAMRRNAAKARAARQAK
jgi:hypothetical protein